MYMNVPFVKIQGLSSTIIHECKMYMNIPFVKIQGLSSTWGWKSHFLGTFKALNFFFKSSTFKVFKHPYEPCVDSVSVDLYILFL